MSKFSYLVNDLRAGEITPKSYARSDLDVFKKSCKTLENAIPYVQGGGGRRPGSYFIANSVVESLFDASLSVFNSNIRLINFRKSKTIGSVLLIRPNADQSEYTLTTSCDIYSDETYTARDTNPAFGGVNYKNIPAIDWIEIYNVAFLIPNSSSFKGYLESELNQIQYAQFGDIMILVHPNRVPLIIQRRYADANYDTFVAYPFYLKPNQQSKTTASFYTIESVSFPDDAWPYQPVNANANHTLSFSGTTGSVTVTSSVGFFVAAHVGAMFKLSSGGFFEITAVTNGTTATARVTTTLGSASASANWQESYWSNARGWPRTIAFHQGRAVYGGSAAFPDTIWGSETGDIQQFDGGTGDTAPYALTITAGDGSEINWMIAGTNLNIGTRGKEIIASAPDPTASFGTDNVDFRAESEVGSSYIQAQKVGNAIYFVDRDGRTLREFVFNFQEDSFRPDNLSLLADHMLDRSLEIRETQKVPEILQMQYQGGNASTFWFIDSNGSLFGCTRDRPSQMLAWHFHKLGGDLDDEPPKVLSICTATIEDGTSDGVYALVQRTINGATAYYFERIEAQYFRTDPASESFDMNAHLNYCDSQVVRFSVSPATNFTGLKHLIGQTVDVIADGKYEGQFVIDADGELDILSAASFVVVGLPYRQIIEPIFIDAGSVIGSGLHQTKTIDRAVIRFSRAVFCKFGRNVDNLEDIIFRPNDIPMGDATPFYRGIKDQIFRGNYTRESTVVIVNDKPFPLDVTGIAVTGVTNEG